MTGIEIERARAEDAPAVAAFQTLAWQQTYRGIIDDALLDVPVADRVGRWAERIRSGSRVVTVARADGVVVGVASTAIDDRPHAGLPPLELCTLYLERDVQGTGLGARLLHAAIGDEDAHLLVFDVNGRARRFYERRGFRPESMALLDAGTGLTERRWVRRRAAHEGNPGR